MYKCLLSEYPCVICKKEVVNDAIGCSLCDNWTHRKCAKISKKELHKLSDENYYWYCVNCTEVFPYSKVNQDELQFMFISDKFNQNECDLFKKCRDIELEFFRYNEYNISDNRSNVDPDNNFYNSLNSDCDYLTDHNFAAKFKNIQGFSVIHFNCRSIRSCFDDLKQYLSDIGKKFDVICISESWLTSNDDLNEYSIECYDAVSMNRTNKRGGGVMIYVSSGLNFSVVDKMTECVDDQYECVTIEINVKNSKNIIVSCIYRTPSSCLKFVQG